MNIRKIKLALTVGLMNLEPGNVLQGIREVMQDFRDEAGAFLNFRLVRSKELNANLLEQTYAMQFERVTLNVDLVSNRATNTEVVRTFSLN